MAILFSKARIFREWNWCGEVSGVEFCTIDTFDATVGEVYYAKWHYMKYCTQVIKYSLRRNTDPDSDAKRKRNRKNLKNCYQFLPLFDVEMILKTDFLCYFLFFGNQLFLFVVIFVLRLVLCRSLRDAAECKKNCAGETCACVTQLKMRRPWHRRSLGDKRMLVPILTHLKWALASPYKPFLRWRCIMVQLIFILMVADFFFAEGVFEFTK